MAEADAKAGRVEESGKRVRVYLGGELVADTTRPLLVWERPHYPTYHLPAGDVREGLLVPTADAGDGVFTVQAGGKEAVAAARRTEHGVRFDWRAMDAWFEEDEEVFVHARDPYKRVDVLPSSRHIRVDIGDVTVADSTHAAALFETSLPTRWYLPKVDVSMDLLRPTSTVTHCPYKGAAEYWSVTVDGTEHVDIAWSYRTPVPESIRVAGRVCFYNEKVDLFVDGELQERPRTPFS